MYHPHLLTLSSQFIDLTPADLPRVKVALPIYTHRTAKKPSSMVILNIEVLKDEPMSHGEYSHMHCERFLAQLYNGGPFSAAMMISSVSDGNYTKYVKAIKLAVDNGNLRITLAALNKLLELPDPKKSNIRQLRDKTVIYGGLFCALKEDGVLIDGEYYSTFSSAYHRGFPPFKIASIEAIIDYPEKS